jgi:Fe2+ or Zn2+ uptake regulation protein
VDARSAIGEACLRITRQRVAVLEAVHRRPHVSAAGVLADVAAVLPDVSHQAVYDCLAHLTGAGLLRRLTVDGGPMLYETNTPGDHHHFVCRTCNDVVDVNCAVDAGPSFDAPFADHFVVEHAEVIYRGFCPACVDGARSTQVRSQGAAPA